MHIANLQQIARANTAIHIRTAYAAGIPSSVIRLRMLHASRASTDCPSDLANTPDNPTSRTASTASRLRGLDRWHNALRAPADCSVIQRTAVVGTVADDSTDLALYAIDEVDAEMQLLPATNALAAVFDGGPLAFAEDAEPAAVDDQIHPAKLLRHP